MKTIICLFSIANEYEQPGFNLEAWFQTMPSFDYLIKHFNVNMKDSEGILKIAQLLNMGQVRFGEYHYRFQSVPEAVFL